MQTAFRFKRSDKIAVLTGAGVSAESGLKTFRDHDGLWESHKVEEIATLEAFQKNPEKVWCFYKQRYYQLSDASANPGHFALKELEDYLQDNFNLITQNVDGLHARAGNKRLIEMHGNLNKCFCIKCGAEFALDKIDLDPSIPKCPECNDYLRPDIVLFGEIPYKLETIFKILVNLDFFLVIGTSGSVYPAAQFLQIAKTGGATTIGVNLEKPNNLRFIDEFHQGQSGILLPALLKEWLKK